MELTILLLACIVGICSGLREVRIQIPTAVKKGDSAILNCWYDTEGDPLYAVKWYKGGREFYRYAPNETPVVKTFPIGNLTVKKTESNATQVSLTNLELDAAGAYSCEVSADAPSFHTAIVDATMNVVAGEVLRPHVQPPGHQRVRMACLPDRPSVSGYARPFQRRRQAEGSVQRLDIRHLLAEHRGQHRGGQAQGDTLRARGDHRRHQLSATAPELPDGTEEARRTRRSESSRLVDDGTERVVGAAGARAVSSDRHSLTTLHSSTARFGAVYINRRACKGSREGGRFVRRLRGHGIHGGEKEIVRLTSM
ncbi:uncharacterized protein LOC143209685 isoform X1 [Lasioglossum baleicum]|uniref:uncharacterized protein LOC143209685 isoform X1 n=1 Tax=Lasioglossum baleicum TaxID=434251 RepID=UPI003FCC9CBD